MTILLLACFVGGFIYFGMNGDDEQATHLQAKEAVVMDSDAVDEFVALMTFASGLLLYGFCPLFRLGVNAVVAFGLGRALVDRLVDDG